MGAAIKKDLKPFWASLEGANVTKRLQAIPDIGGMSFFKDHTFLMLKLNSSDFNHAGVVKG